MIQHYRRMVDDPVRVAAFRRAIARAVRPGDVVADVGCALGNYTVFACRAGARRVLAVEVAPVIAAAREVVAASGCGDRVRFLPGFSTDLEVPERARVVIFEDYPTTLLGPRPVQVVRDLVSRWLARGGRLVPDRARLWLAAVEDETSYRDLDRFGRSGQKSFEVDLAPTRARAFAEPQSARLGAAALLSRPVLAARLDLRGLRSPEVALHATVTARRAGTLHGLVLWFELHLAGRWLGTGPLDPPIAWQHTLFPFAEPLRLEEGARLRLSLESGSFGQDLVWRWRAEAGRRKAEGDSLARLAPGSEDLVRWQPGHVPPVHPDLDVDRYVLGLVDGRRSLGGIAARLRRRFPRRFPRPADAERRVALVLGIRPPSSAPSSAPRS